MKLLVTGAAGLAGSASVRCFAGRGWRVHGLDNDLRAYFFGPAASTQPALEELVRDVPSYVHHAADIRDAVAVERVFREHGPFDAVVHAAGQPSHDWAAREPFTDFDVNARGTLNLLEATRRRAPDAVFLFTSTNKVYGDTPNRLPLVEGATRWEVDPAHPFAANGIDETMSVDQTRHSVFGASKLAADVMVQEYGRYFGLRTGVFRGGCFTGPRHAGAELHGFLAYLVKCAATGREYRIYGYRGKQVRDNIHCDDLADAFWHFAQAPRAAEVYNIGGGRFSHCSVREAVALCGELTGRPLKTVYVDQPRAGDPVWWISDCSKFRAHYPAWAPTKRVPDILAEILVHNRGRWDREAGGPA